MQQWRASKAGGKGPSRSGRVDKRNPKHEVKGRKGRVKNTQQEAARQERAVLASAPQGKSQEYNIIIGYDNALYA